jgi:VIT1/CCC1 family predicted Fe2+/Mn2+ transporter
MSWADGLTVPLALAAGLSAAVSSTKIIVTAGLAEIVAGAIAMGLGRYLAARTDQEHYQSEDRREYGEVDNPASAKFRKWRQSSRAMASKAKGCGTLWTRSPTIVNGGSIS